MAKIAQNLLTNQFNSLQRSIGKSAVSAMLQEWKWEPLIDSELEEWLLSKGESNYHCGDSSLKSHDLELFDGMSQDLSDLGVPENNYWLEEFPLFEEIQPLDDVKIQSKQASQDEKKFCSDKGSLSFAQDLLSTSIENATLVFSTDNVVFIKSDSQAEEGENLLNVIACESGKSSAENLATNGRGWEEMDAVEEIIRNAAMELDPWESDSTGSETSSDSPAACDSGSGSLEGEESDDPEWNPKGTKIPVVSNHRPRNVRPKSSSSRSSKQGETVEDKRLRKKEQNKYAATRYRLKKKAEVSELLNKEEQLKEKKRKLEERVEDIGNEIRCLKGLMRDFFKAKGLL